MSQLLNLVGDVGNKKRSAYVGRQEAYGKYLNVQFKFATEFKKTP